MFSSAAALYYSPTKQPHGSSSSASSPTLLVPDSHRPGGREVASDCGFHLRSLVASDAEHLLMCLLAISVSLEMWPFESFAQF